MSKVKTAVGYVIKAVRKAGVTVLTPEVLYKAIINCAALERQETSILFCGLYDLVVVVYYYKGKLPNPSEKIQQLTAEYRKSQQARPTAIDFAMLIENALVNMGFTVPLTGEHVRALEMCKTVADFDSETLALAICYITLVSRLLHEAIFESINLPGIHLCAESLAPDKDDAAISGAPRRPLSACQASLERRTPHPVSSASSSISTRQPVRPASRAQRLQLASAPPDVSVPELLSNIHEDLEAIRRYSRSINLLLPRWSCDVSEVLHPYEIAEIMDGRQIAMELERSKNALYARKEANSVECLQRLANANLILDTVISVIYKGMATKKDMLREGEVYLDIKNCISSSALKSILDTTYLLDESVTQASAGSKALLPFIKGGEKYHESLRGYIQRHSEKHSEALTAATRSYNNICKGIADFIMTAENIGLRRLRDFSVIKDKSTTRINS